MLESSTLSSSGSASASGRRLHLLDRRQTGVHVHVALNQLGRLAEGLFGSDGAVGPDLEHQALVVGHPTESRHLDPEVGLGHRRVRRVDGDEPDIEIFGLVLLGLDIAATGGDAHVHLERAVDRQGRDVDIRSR